jgi:hypothetical protein
MRRLPVAALVLALVALLLPVAGAGAVTHHASAKTRAHQALSVGFPASAIASPSSKTMLWGAWTDRHVTGTLAPWDMSSMNVLERQVGKGQSLLHFGIPMIGTTGAYYGFPTAQMENARDHGSIPFLSWSTMQSGNYRNPGTTLSAILAGKHDDWIRTFATAARAWGKPFFLRFDWEMNGNWFPWGAATGNNTAARYVAMWRHVHDIFDSVGATNATWVWCPTADKHHVEPDIAKLYPGDRYVDWTCIDGYNTNDGNAKAPYRSFSDVVGTTYDEIQEIAPDKPMVIGETGTTEIGGDKAQWITDMFKALPTRFPNIRGLIWFNSNTGTRYADMALDSSASATSAFARGIASSRFLSNQFAGLADSPVSTP